MIFNTPEINQKEIKDILDRYYRRRVKELAKTSDPQKKAAKVETKLVQDTHIPVSTTSINVTEVDRKSSAKKPVIAAEDHQIDYQDSPDNNTVLDTEEKVAPKETTNPKSHSSSEGSKGTDGENENKSKFEVKPGKKNLINLIKTINKTKEGNFTNVNSNK